MIGRLSWSLSAFHSVSFYWSNPRKWAMDNKGSISAKKPLWTVRCLRCLCVSSLQRLRASSEQNWKQRKFGKGDLDSATSPLGFEDVWGLLPYRGRGSCFVPTVLLLFPVLAETLQNLLIEGRTRWPQASRQLVSMHTGSNMSVEPRLQGRRQRRNASSAASSTVSSTAL